MSSQAKLYHKNAMTAKIMCQIASILGFYDETGGGLDINEIGFCMNLKGWTNNRDILIEILNHGVQLGIFNKTLGRAQHSGGVSVRYKLSYSVAEDQSIEKKIRRNESNRRKILKKVDSIEVNKARILKKRGKKPKSPIEIAPNTMESPPRTHFVFTEEPKKQLVHKHVNNVDVRDRNICRHCEIANFTHCRHGIIRDYDSQ